MPSCVLARHRGASRLGRDAPSAGGTGGHFGPPITYRARVAFLREEAVIRELDVFGDQLAPVDGRLVMPPDPSAQVEDVGRLIRLVPSPGQLWLDGEATRCHPGADLVAQQPAVDEAQRVMRLAAQDQMRVEVGRIVAPHAENSAALGLSPTLASRECRFG